MFKKKKVAEDHPFHLSNQAVQSVGHVGALQRRVAPPATAPTLPPAVTHAGARLNTGSARPAALMLRLEPSHILLSGSFWSTAALAGAELLVSRRAGLLLPPSLPPPRLEEPGYPPGSGSGFSADPAPTTPEERLQKGQGWQGAWGCPQDEAKWSLRGGVLSPSPHCPVRLGPPAPICRSLTRLSSTYPSFPPCQPGVLRCFG